MLCCYTKYNAWIIFLLSSNAKAAETRNILRLLLSGCVQLNLVQRILRKFGINWLFAPFEMALMMRLKSGHSLHLPQAPRQ